MMKYKLQSNSRYEYKPKKEREEKSKGKFTESDTNEYISNNNK